MTNKTTTAIANTGTTGHFLLPTSMCGDIKPVTQGITVQMPNGSQITSTHTAQLNILQDLPASARHAHILPGLATHALISIAVLCDNKCKAIFEYDKITITKNDITILQGQRDWATGLWMLPLTANINVDQQGKQKLQDHKCNMSSEVLSSTLPELITFLVRALWSPTKATLISAIDHGLLSTWPQLTSANVRKYLPKLKSLSWTMKPINYLKSASKTKK